MQVNKFKFSSNGGLAAVEISCDSVKDFRLALLAVEHHFVFINKAFPRYHLVNDQTKLEEAINQIPGL